MTDPMVLIDVCGTCLADAVLLACPADEWFDETGDISPTSRTLLFRLNGGAPRYFGMLPFPVRNGWSSPHATYLSMEADYLYVVEGADWTRFRREEVVPGEATDWGVWGFGGTSAESDKVFLGGNECLYVRSEGDWKRIPAPRGAGRINEAHGLRADECYLGSELGLLKWDGQQISDVEEPDGAGITHVRVLSDEELLATTGSGIFRWSDTTGWSEIKSAFIRPTTLAKVGEEIFCADWRAGVLRINRMNVVQERNVKSCFPLIELADGVVAISSDGQVHALYDGESWKDFTIPGCPPGGTP